MVKQRINTKDNARSLASVNTWHRPRKIACWATFALLVLGQLMCAKQVLACAAGINSDLEQLYCALVAKGEGAGLPSFDDFRRNPPTTQQLLLKRPAKRAGLAMPDMPRAAKAQASIGKPQASSSKPQSSPVTAKAPNTVAEPKARAAANGAGQNKALAAAVPSTLKGCTLAAQGIQCGNAHYRLLDNRSNKALAQGALGASNSLVLPPVPNYRSNADLHNYLQRAYTVYLTKMDNIGLSGATLSYSKFYYIFDDSLQQKQDFVGRFSLMYDFLKKDKSTMAVARQHRGKTPPALSACQSLGHDFITCDSRGSNWVYSRLVL